MSLLSDSYALYDKLWGTSMIIKSSMIRICSLKCLKGHLFTILALLSDSYVFYVHFGNLEWLNGTFDLFHVCQVAKPPSFIRIVFENKTKTDPIRFTPGNASKSSHPLNPLLSHVHIFRLTTADNYTHNSCIHPLKHTNVRKVDVIMLK